MTTAQKLNAYRRELLDGGMDPEVVPDLVRDAARALLPVEGLTVGAANTTGAPTVPTHT